MESIRQYWTTLIYQAHGQRLTQCNNLLLNPAALQSPLENWFGFADGTTRPISRPSENQITVYNGPKRVHALYSQSVTTPNRLLPNLYRSIGFKADNCVFLLIFLSPSLSLNYTYICVWLIFQKSACRFQPLYSCYLWLFFFALLS